MYGTSPLGAPRWEALTLALSDLIVGIARCRSMGVASRHSVSHTDPDGSDYLSLLTSNGYPWLSAAENLNCSKLRDSGAIQPTTDFWTTDPEHDVNTFNANFDAVGIGVAEACNGLYFSAILAQR